MDSKLVEITRTALREVIEDWALMLVEVSSMAGSINRLGEGSIMVGLSELPGVEEDRPVVISLGTSEQFCHLLARNVLGLEEFDDISEQLRDETFYEFMLVLGETTIKLLHGRRTTKEPSLTSVSVRSPELLAFLASPQLVISADGYPLVVSVKN